jgi:hypothetical protein
VNITVHTFRVEWYRTAAELGRFPYVFGVPSVPRPGMQFEPILGHSVSAGQTRLIFLLLTNLDV